MSIKKKHVDLLDAEASFEDAPGGGLIIRKDQEITDQFLADQRDARLNSAHAREGEFMEICALPTALVEMWQRQGFDIFDKNVKARDIVKRLINENLTDFLSTNKRV